MSIPVDSIGLYVNEKEVVGFDYYSSFPAIQAGETLSNVRVPAVSGLTIGTPEVNASRFFMGGGRGYIEIGKGVVCTFKATVAGTYVVTCWADFSGGATDRQIKVNLVFE